MHGSSDGPASSLLGLPPSFILLGVGILAEFSAFVTDNVFGGDTSSYMVLLRHFVDQLFDVELYQCWLVVINNSLASFAMLS